MFMIFKNFKKLAVLWLPVFLWAGLIYYVSSISSLISPFGKWDFILRKSAHVLEYAVLSYLLLRAFCGYRPKGIKQISAALFLAVLYAFSDEYHQSFVTGRFCSLTDVFIDCAGCLLGLIPKHQVRQKSDTKPFPSSN